MAQNNVSDLIMKFVDDDGPLDGETQTELNLRKGPMTSGFSTGKMFEVESFTVKTGLKGSNEDSDTAQLRGDVADQHAQIMKHLQALAAAQKGGKLPDLKSKSTMDFVEFRSGDDNTPYPVDLKPVEFSRGIDRSSPKLLSYCINRKVLKSASIIKRKAAGTASSGEVFLRFDFDTVLITSVDWDNDDPVKENVEFVCRALTMHYLPQLPDGTLGAPIQAFWSAAKGLSPVDLR